MTLSLEAIRMRFISVKLRRENTCLSSYNNMLIQVLYSFTLKVLCFMMQNAMSILKPPFPTNALWCAVYDLQLHWSEILIRNVPDTTTLTRVMTQNPP